MTLLNKLIEAISPVVEKEKKVIPVTDYQMSTEELTKYKKKFHLIYADYMGMIRKISPLREK
jgi:hypothetical protein